ncbi:MAG: PAS domain-containing protein [Rubrivivax sp.]|jgi:PAS domain S-box-containing protein|nr:PAS domain-containing protein [Rubrivivax sp.]
MKPDDDAAADPLPGARLPALDRHMARITQVAGIGYWSVHVRQRSARWSPELRALHGLGEADPLPLPDEWLTRWVHPDDRQATRRVLLDWLAGRADVLEHALRIVRADGSQRELLTHSLVEVSDDADLRFGVVIDVTPLRRTEQALREAEGRAALIAGAIGMGIWEIDLQTQDARWDDAMWRLRGLEPQPRPPHFAARVALLHPDDRERVAEINRSSRVENYEFRVVWPDGQLRWLAARSALLHDEQGRPLRRIGVNWDITEQRAAEDALRAREIALRESETRARTLARMSHELRTPLNAILGCTQLLQAGAGADPLLRQRHLAEVESAGRQLLALVDRVLDLTTAAPAPPPACAPAPVSPARHTLLYIEDNSVNAMIVGELVARRGDIELLIADTGTEGLRLALERQPALVLLDMQLPDIDGPEVFRRLRADARTAALPCIALSANALQEDIDAALAAGMTGYWTKPLDFAAFTQALAAVFGPPGGR